jgi:hypothetical protein
MSVGYDVEVLVYGEYFPKSKVDGCIEDSDAYVELIGVYIEGVCLNSVLSETILDNVRENLLSIAHDQYRLIKENEDDERF